MRAATGLRGHLSLLGGCIRNAGIETAVSGGVPPPVRPAWRRAPGMRATARRRSRCRSPVRPARRRAPRHARGGLGVDPDGPPIPTFRHRFAPPGGGRLPCRRLSRRKDARGAPDAGTAAAGSAADDAGTGKTTRAPGRRRGHPGRMRHAPRRPGRRNGGGRKRREPRGHLIGKESNSTTGLVLVATLLLWVSMRLMSTAAVSRVLPKSISKSSFDVPSKETLRTLPVL